MNAYDEMTDNDVLRAACELLWAIPVAPPPDVEAVMARGDASWRRRLAAVTHPSLAAARLPGRQDHPRTWNRRLSTGLTAVAACAALLLGLGLSGAFRPSPPPSRPVVQAKLAAWTVVKQADGTVLVKIREFRDPAALQRKLREDGIPASVKFNPANLVGKGPWAIVRFKGNPCQEYSGGEGQAQNVVTGGNPFTVGMFVHPSAIPKGAGMQFVASRNLANAAQGDARWDLFEWLVQSSPGCTGS
ncbi:MAG TPA: hypothetical protein VGP46_00760 [Acidimicrobiales bacterium]|jgi:hypothetical protein|nr:hypothetical protein [Acidimicrobiales bacterium]